MHREYKLAAGLLAISATLMIGAAFAVTTGVGAELAGDPIDDVIDKNESQTDDVVIEHNANTGNGTVIVEVDQSANRTQSELSIDGRTIVLDEDQRDALFAEQSRTTVGETVWAAVSDEAAFGDIERVQLKVDQIYESGAHESPTDEAVVHVRPAEGRLPEVTAIVTLTDIDNQSTSAVQIESVHPALGDVDVSITDDIGVIDDQDAAVLEDVVEDNGEVSYYLQQEYDDIDTVDATVVEATNDGEVEVHLSSPDANGSTVGMTLDLESESVRNTWVIVDLDESDIDTENVTMTDGTNETVTFNATD